MNMTYSYVRVCVRRSWSVKRCKWWRFVWGLCTEILADRDWGSSSMSAHCCRSSSSRSRSTSCSAAASNNASSSWASRRRSATNSLRCAQLESQRSGHSLYEYCCYLCSWHTALVGSIIIVGVVGSMKIMLSNSRVQCRVSVSCSLTSARQPSAPRTIWWKRQSLNGKVCLTFLKILF